MATGTKSQAAARVSDLSGADFTLEFVAGLLEQQGLLSEDSRKTAIARERVQRARVLREISAHATEQTLRRAEVSPIELLASYAFKNPHRASETLDEDKVAQAVAKALGFTYRKIDTLKL